MDHKRIPEPNELGLVILGIVLWFGLEGGLDIIGILVLSLGIGLYCGRNWPWYFWRM